MNKITVLSFISIFYLSALNAVEEVKTAARFKELLNGDKPLVVKFSAAWCGACKHFKPTFEKAAAKYSDKAVFVVIDADSADLKAIVDSHDITGLPTTKMIYKGKELVKPLGGSVVEDGFELILQDFFSKINNGVVVSKQQNGNGNNVQKADASEFGKSTVEKIDFDDADMDEMILDDEDVMDGQEQAIQEVASQNDYNKLIRGKGLVVIKLYTKTCPFCIEYAPLFEDAAAKYQGIAVFAQADLNNKNIKFLKDQHAKRGAPTTIFIRDGKVVYKETGVLNDKKFAKSIDIAQGKKSVAKLNKKAVARSNGRVARSQRALRNARTAQVQPRACGW